MRTRALVILTYILTGCAGSVPTTTNSGAPARTALFEQYDHVRGLMDISTIVFIRNGTLAVPTVEFHLLAQHPDTVLRKPLETVLLLFKASSGRNWSFLRNHELTLLLNDSSRLTFEGARQSEVRTWELKEDIAFVVPVSDLLNIGNSKSVEGRLGGWGFSLSPKEIAIVKEMAAFASNVPDAPRPKRGRDH